MKLPLSFALALLPLLSHAATFKLKQVKQPRHSPALVPRQTPSDGQVAVGAGANAVNLTSAHDLVYLADITIAGVDYTVQLDTGSSDLWIKPPSVPLSGVTYTNHNINFTYSIGWANGTVAFAPVEFLGLPVASQAFLQVSTASNAVLSSAVGGDGVAGLGFTGRSGIDAVLNQTGVSTGRSLLYNLFMVHPDEPNFIAFALQRDHSGNATDVEGSFSIGEYDPAYAYVAGNERIPTFPVHNPHRWNVLLDALIINNPDNTNNILVPKSRLPYTPSNKAVVLLDSGASHTFCPPEMATALYGNITGAYFSESLGYWVVPCNTQINMALQIGGQIYPLNPLDVVTPTYGDQNTCIGTFIPSAPAESSEFDWLIGDNFLRNVYSVYDFGDFDENGKMGDPYIKLAATTDPEDASAEFAALMNSTARSIITYVGLQGAEVDPVFFVTKDISESLVLIGKLVPAMLGLVALNALVITVCAIFWLVSFLRKRRNRRTAREPRGRATPMQLTPRNSYIPGTPPPMPHVYEPVSMALTEDTFVPPSPAFRSKIQAGDRPKSVA